MNRIAKRVDKKVQLAFISGLLSNLIETKSEDAIRNELATLGEYEQGILCGMSCVILAGLDSEMPAFWIKLMSESLKCSFVEFVLGSKESLEAN